MSDFKKTYVYLCFLLFCGCRDEVKRSVVYPFSVRASANSEAIKLELKTLAQLDFGPRARVLYVDNGGGKEPQYSYMEYVLFEPDSFRVTIENKNTFNSYPDGDVIDEMTEIIPHLKNAPCEVKTKLFYEASGFVWTLFMLRNEGRDYLLVKRIVKR